MSFPINDKYWVNTAEFLQKNIQSENRVVAPDEFKEKFIGFISYESIIQNSSNDFQWVIIHKGMMENLEYAFLDKVVNEYNPVFANEVFVIFTKHTSIVALNHDFIHLQNFWEKINLLNNIYTIVKTRSQNKSGKNEVFFNIKDISLLTRTELESNCRKMSQTVYMGNETILCRVLTKYMCFVEAQDMSLTPHLCLNGYWESWITQAMIRLLQPGYYCLDIGANWGYYSLIMADIVGESGHVLSVEPNPRLANLLKKSLNINGFSGYAKVSEKAVADTNGKKVNLVIPKGDFWGSSTICQTSVLPGEQSFEVETVTIDELTQDWPRVDLIKIDAEGAEEAIWLGMQETIQKNKNIIITMEFACDRGYNPKLFLQDIQAQGFPLRYIDNDSQIKSLSLEECVSKESGQYWDLFLQREK
ncbi:FkbM family methyltransferase [Nostoc sp. WHI]|uniref:FkbM family methyltransferase n=1 Tax=Nostoc sp. WHI TaxID=2650611 RepID=UPI0018C5DF60|nr:FkbM family methyltransferase [Nostoc sp. WHI]MBG1270759.1 FkbM family methyltransferase [Nostoc sp. WHI]